MDLTTMPTLAVTESGGEIKMRRSMPKERGLVQAEIVLAHLPHNEITPYATWQRNVEDGGSYWGHYFKDGEEEEALADFNARGR